MDKKLIEKRISKIVKNQKKPFVPGKSRIKYAHFKFEEKEINTSINALLDSFEKNWFALGQNAKEFQNKFAKFIGVRGAVFVNSGSSANLIAVATLIAQDKIKAGDEFVTLATTFPTTINPGIIYGLKPVLVDIELPSYTVNIKELEKAITKKTKLIMLPHINGSPHNMKEIMRIARKNKISVIEDCCDSLGTKIDKKYVGSYGDLATFSFYAAHHMSTGEGGCVVSNSKELLDTAESIRDWGRTTFQKTKETSKRKLSFQKISKKLPKDYEERYTYSNIGYNLKPLDFQAALGLIQLKKLKGFTLTRIKNYQSLVKGLEKYASEIILPKGIAKSEPSWFVFPITLKNNSKIKRSELVQFLEKNNIETRPMLAGNITGHPAYEKIKFRKIGKLSITNKVLKDTFVIGIHPGIGKEELKFIVNSFKKILN